MTKKVNVFGKILCVAALLALAGLLIYLISNSTGYLKQNGAVLNVIPILLPLCVIILAVFLQVVPNIINDTCTGIVTFLMSVAMGYSLITLVVDRIDLIADLMNPVNHPANEYTAFTWTAIAIGLYAVAFIGTLIATMGTRIAKAKK